jgi:AAA+ lid domain
VDLEQLARDTHGFVGADISQLCMESALYCIRQKMDIIDVDADTIPAEVLDGLVRFSSYYSVYMYSFLQCVCMLAALVVVVCAIGTILLLLLGSIHVCIVPAQYEAVRCRHGAAVTAAAAVSLLRLRYTS